MLFYIVLKPSLSQHSSFRDNLKYLILALFHWVSRNNNSHSDRVQLTKREFLGAAVGTGLLAATTTPTTATDGGDGGDGDGGSGTDDGGGSQETYSVTLITGHTVYVEEETSVEVSDDGVEEETVQRTYSVDTDDEPEVLDVIEEPDATYIIPKYVDTSVFARHLFDVDFLIEQGYTDEDWDHTPVFVREGDGPSAMTDGGRQYTSTDAVAVDVPKPGQDDIQAMDANAFSNSNLERVFLNAQDEVFLDTNTGPIGAPDAREAFEVTGEGVVVGIVDTGIDDTHPDLEGRVVDEVDFSDEDEVGEDNNGHGTSVAGVIGGSGVKDEDVVGIAPDVEYVDAKAFPEEGTTTREQVLQAVEWAIDEADPQPDVLNLSLGGPIVEEEDPVVEACNRAAKEEGIFVSVSAGNTLFQGYESITNPAQGENVTTVGATDRTGDEVGQANFSAWGPSPFDRRLKPEVMAPGVEITTAASDGQELPGDFPYRDISGTSFSAPMVAGLAALLFEIDDELDPQTIEDHAVTTAEPIADIDEDDPFQQGAGEVRMEEAIGTDVVVENAATSLGIVEDAVETEVPVTVKNLGDEEVTLTVTETTAYEINDGIEDEDVLSVAEDEVTIGAGETAEVTVTADLAFGEWGGLVVFEDDDGETYRSIVGVSVAVEAVVELIQNEDSGLETAAGEFAAAYDTDGEVVQTGDFDANNEFRFLQFAGERTYDFVGGDEFEPDEDAGQDLSGEPILAFAHEETISADDRRVEIDANDVGPREFDLDTLPNDGPFQAEDVDFEIYHEATTASFSRGFSGDFRIFTGHFGPTDDDLNLNVGIANLFAPEDQVPDGSFVDATEAEDIYHLVNTSTDHTVDGQVLDPELAIVDTEYFFSNVDATPSHSPGWFPADLETFPRLISFTFVNDIRDDDQSWYLTEDASYSYTWRDDSIANLEARYTFEDGELVPTPGTEVSTTVGYEPLFPRLTDWEVGDDEIDARLIPYRDQGAVPFVTYEQDFDNQNVVDVFVDDELLGSVDYFGFGFNFSVSGLEEGDTVRLETESRTLEGSPSFGTTAELVHETTLGTDTDTPPQLEQFSIPGLTRDNVLNSGIACAVVEFEEGAPRGRSGLADFDAFYGGAEDVETVAEPGDWEQAEVLFEDDGTYAVRFDTTDWIGDDLAFAAAATDRDDNFTATSSIGVCPVDEWATEGIDMSFRGSRGDDITVRLDTTTADDVDIDTIKFGTPDAVYDGDGVEVDSYRELGNNHLELTFSIEGSGLPEDADIKPIPANASGRFAPDYDVIEPIVVTGSTDGDGERFAAAHVVLIDE